MARIFICYRSGDDAFAAPFVDHMLSAVYGRDNVFRASRSIRPGEDYVVAIHEAVIQCETMLVLIGATWQDKVVAGGHGPEDWVQAEIVTALKRDTHVIPVLLNNAPLLVPTALPSSIEELGRRQYVRLHYRSVEHDIEELMRAIDGAETSISLATCGRELGGDGQTFGHTSRSPAHARRAAPHAASTTRRKLRAERG